MNMRLEMLRILENLEYKRDFPDGWKEDVEEILHYLMLGNQNIYDAIMEEDKR